MSIGWNDATATIAWVTDTFDNSYAKAVGPHKSTGNPLTYFIYFTPSGAQFYSAVGTINSDASTGAHSSL